METYGGPSSSGHPLGLLADPTRRAITELLADRPRSVGQLAAALPVSRPAVSQHLRALKDAGLVADRAEGTRRVYRLDPAGLTGLRDYLDRLWSRALRAYAAAADGLAGHPDQPRGGEMGTTSTIPAVHQSVIVQPPAARAFDVFVRRLADWWPAGYHIGGAAPADVRLEARAGGRWYEVGPDGTECDWGRVLVYDPPHRLVLAWHIDGEWRYRSDPAQASEVEVTFTDLGAGGTRVDLVHGGFERHGATGGALRGAVGADSGWAVILGHFRDTADRAE